MKMLKKIIISVENFLLPDSCLLCQRQGYVLCPACRSRLPKENTSKEKIFVFTLENKESKKIIEYFRNRGLKKLAPILVGMIYRIFVSKFKNLNKEQILIIPRPIKKSQRRKQGYSQNELLAKYLSQKTSWPYSFKFKYANIFRKEKFYINKAEIENRDIILIQDLLDNKSESEEMISYLLNLKARQVYLLAFARRLNFSLQNIKKELNLK